MGETLHRHDEGGPTAHISCDGDTATASWHLPEGQILDDHPELGAGGYAYFTLHDTPTVPVEGADVADFSGANFGPDAVLTLDAPIESGVEYRAHLLVAYEDGPAWHNDTVFVCEAPVAVVTQPPALEVLPFTGIEGWLFGIGLLCAGVGSLLVRKGA